MIIICEQCKKPIDIPSRHECIVECSCGAKYAVDLENMEYHRRSGDEERGGIIERIKRISTEILEQQMEAALAGNGPYPSAEKIMIQTLLAIYTENVVKSIVAQLKEGGVDEG